MHDSPVYFDAFTRIGPRPSMHAAQRYTLQHLLDEMAHCSISAALVSSTACMLYDAMLGNLRLCDALEPYDHLFPIWNVMPHWTGEMPEPEELTAQMNRHGVRAVTLMPGSNGWCLSSSSSQPLLQELQRAAILVIVDVREMEPIEVEHLAQTYPQLPILMTGLLWTQQRWSIPLLLAHKNLHVAFDHFQINMGLEWLVARGCEDQLIYASNATDMAMGAHRCYVDYAEVSDATREKVACGNLTRLLKGLAPPRAVKNDREDSLMAQARRGEPLSTRVVDMHAHILDEGLQGAGGSHVMFDGGPAGVQRLARRMGVDAMGMMSWNGPVGVHAEQGNRCVLAALDAMPEGYWGLATFDVMHDTAEQAQATMREIFSDPRFLGFKPYPRYGKHYDDPAYKAWWEFGNARGLYALLHVNRADLSEIDILAPLYPDMTWVVAHCGSSFAMADQAIRVARAYPNVMLEITLTPVWLGIIDYLVAGAGPDRVMYGSDLPMRDPRPQFGWVVFSRLSLEAKRQVLGLNAAALLERIGRPAHVVV